MYCKWCGAEYSDNSRFCSNCGRSLIVEPIASVTSPPTSQSNIDSQNILVGLLVFTVITFLAGFIIGGILLLLLVVVFAVSDNTEKIPGYVLGGIIGIIIGAIFAAMLAITLFSL